MVEDPFFSYGLKNESIFFILIKSCSSSEEFNPDESITLFPWVLPFCLFPIFNVGTFNDGTSIKPEDEFPMIPLEFLTKE